MPSTYTGYDPTQNAFLSALAQGETGSAGTGALFEGTGGTDLSTASTDAFGFPQWAGTGTSHAAGIFQFQPSTWDSLASVAGLNFGNVQDQDTAAWTLAQQTYASKTGGDLETDLQAGKFSQIESALAGVWPSVTGSAFGKALTGGTGANVSSTGAISADTSPKFDPLHPITSGAAVIGDEISRVGVLAIGGLVAIVALWWLLSQSGAVPSPGDTARAAGTALAVAA